ncbi:MAG TPA: DUF2167 domain-containing protein [Candidatus Acidoferrales bacterium]|nr:DUF2167 domain-containing protein [Candidatus Acidoferrales bacterium]
MRSRVIPVSLAALGLMCLAIAAGTVPARADQTKSSSGIVWENGPTVGKLGDFAQINIPEGYRFTGKEGALKVMELTQNPASGRELGVLIPILKEGQHSWFVVFEFESTGYVKDEEKDKLDTGAILKSLQEGTEDANKIRAQKGWKAYHVVGWSQAPFYNPATHNLTWSIRGQEEGDPKENVNYSVRLLGRRGTMSADLVLNPDQVATVVPEFEALLSGFSYLPGQKYSEFRAGDKVAEYGLTALIAGGAAAAAIKSGLLAKLWKVLVVAFVALVGAIKKFFAYIKRLFKGEAAEQSTQPQG